MKKLYALLTLLLFAGSMFASTTFTLTMEDYKATSFTAKGVTVKADKGTAKNDPAYNASYKDVRIYAGGTLTLSAESDIIALEFTLSAKGKNRLAPLTANAGSVSEKGDPDFEVKWTGSAKEVVFTVGEHADYGTDGSSASGQLDFTAIKVTLADGSDDPGTVDPTPHGDTLRCNEVMDHTDDDNVYVVKGFITTVSSYSNGTATFHMDDDFWISTRTGFTAVSVHSQSGDVEPKLGDLVWVKAKLHKHSYTEVKTVAGGTYGIIDRGGDVIFIDYYFEEQGVEQEGGEVSDVEDGVTVYASKAYGHMHELRVYKSSVFEISSEDRYISHIRFTFSPSGIQYGYYGGLKAVEKVNAKTWRIESMPSQARISKIEVFYGSGSDEQTLEDVNLSPKVVKTIENGQLIIEKAGIKYNAVGQVVR